jgi:N-acetylglutamate synthase-like GNAT family acetyltransferase
VAVEYREAELPDAQQVSRLLHELDCKDDAATVRRRIERILGLTDHMMFVAVERPHGVVGVVHAEVLVTLMARPRATIRALVVAPDVRESGIGRELLERVHSWALRRGIDDIQVAMQRTRKEGHHFLVKLGYTVSGEHLIYERDLAAPMTTEIPTDFD